MAFSDWLKIDIPSLGANNVASQKTAEVASVEQNNFSATSQSQDVSFEVKYNLADENTQNLLYGALSEQVGLLEKEYETAKKSNGLISGAWDKLKDTFNFGASSEKAQEEIDSAKKELEKVKNKEIDLKEAYKNITGEEPTDDEIDKLLSGEITLKDISKAGENLKNYQEGQKMSTDVVADIVSGIASVGVVAFGTALGVCAAPFTAGASLGAIGVGVALATTTGAAVKSAIKASDCIGNEKKYELQDLGYDILTGGFNGAMGPISNGAGGAVGTGIMKALGMEALETTAKTALRVAGGEVVEEIVEESAEAVAKNAGKTLLQKGGTLLAKGLDMATDGTLSGAADGFSRAVAEGRWEDIPQDTLNNAINGFIASPIIGTAFDKAGKAGSKLANTKAGEIAKELIFDNLGKAGDLFSQLTHEYTPNLANSFDNLGIKINDKIMTTAINNAVVKNSDNSLSVTIGDYVINVASDEIPDEIKGDNLQIYSWLSQGLESFVNPVVDEAGEVVARAYSFNPETDELTPVKPKTNAEVEKVELDFPEAGDSVGMALDVDFSSVDYKNLTPEQKAQIDDCAIGLAVRYNAEIQGIKDKFKKIFGATNEVSARGKSPKSILEKLIAKQQNGELEEIVIEHAAKLIGDGYGIRVQMPSLTQKQTDDIIRESLSGTGKTREQFQKLIDDRKFDELLDDVDFRTTFENLKEARSQSTVDGLIKAIKSKEIIPANAADDYFNNYGSEITSYLTNRQLLQIDAAYFETYGEHLTFVNKTPVEVPNDMLEMSPEAVATRNLASAKKAKKPSGYTDAQFNITTNYTDGNNSLSDMELQIRGEEVHKVAENEHIPYDVRQGKITATNPKYSQYYVPLKGMSPESYNKYNEYLDATYTWSVLKELNLATDVQKPKLEAELYYGDAKYLQQVGIDINLMNKKLTSDEMEKITIEGLKKYKVK